MQQPLISATIEALGSLNGQDTVMVYGVLVVALLLLAVGFARLAMNSKI